MSITELAELIGLISAGVALLATIFGWVRTIINNIKDKKFKALVEEYMAEAEEKFTDGLTKKTYVIEKVIEHYGKDVKDIKDKASDYIEKCIDFSKKVNNKGGKK